jgi:hypothetical protein
VEQTRKKSVWFIVMVIAAVYVLFSIAIAISTVDECGDESADKHWSFVPPRWECDTPNPFN